MDSSMTCCEFFIAFFGLFRCLSRDAFGLYPRQPDMNRIYRVRSRWSYKQKTVRGFISSQYQRRPRR